MDRKAQIANGAENLIAYGQRKRLVSVSRITEISATSSGLIGNKVHESFH